MRILIVGFSDSVHIARWTSHLSSMFKVFLLPSVPRRNIHSDLRHVTVISSSEKCPGDIHTIKVPVLDLLPVRLYNRIIQLLLYGRLKNWVIPLLIKYIKPEILHTMETQHAGYLMSDAIRTKPQGMRWIHSTWGIDLHYFSKFKEHEEKISSLFAKLDLLIVEGSRDSKLANAIGYDGKIETIPSVGGGLDLDLLSSIDLNIVPSVRKLILVKGYNGHERLAEVALKALIHLNEVLYGYTIVIYSCHSSLQPLIEQINQMKGVNVKSMREIEYIELLRLTAMARLTITNNLSDGVPNTMLEGMALGAFPIQSNTAITDEFIKDGVNGLLTNPTEVDDVAKAIQTALENDELVDQAAIFNRGLIRKKLDAKVLEGVIEDIYNSVA